MYGPDWSSPKSKTATMLGWLSEAAARGLVAEAGEEVRVAPELGAQQLDGDVAIELGVARPVDGRHAALPEELDQAIAPAQHAPDLGHGLLVSPLLPRARRRGPRASYRTRSDPPPRQMSSERRYSRNSVPRSGRSSASSTDAWSQPIVVPAS